jgi:hypothetical protein
LSPNFTAIVRAHGKTKAYLYRFKIIESPICPCNGGNHTVDHLLDDFITTTEGERETYEQLIKSRHVAGG